MKAADKAATTIQANFRGYRVRKQLRSTSKKNGPRRRSSSGNTASTNSSSRSTQTPTTQSAPPSATTADHPVTAERGDHQEVDQKEMAVIKIQAGVRGYLVRKRKQTETAAATKIQEQYRAFRERQNDNKRQPGK